MKTVRPKIQNVLPSESMITIIEWKRKTRERKKKNIGYDKTGYLRISSGQVGPSPGSSRRLIE